MEQYEHKHPNSNKAGSMSYLSGKHKKAKKEALDKKKEYHYEKGRTKKDGKYIWSEK